MLNLFVARKWEIMAVVSLFTVALLTEGRSARDLPKQHPDKKTKSQGTRTATIVMMSATIVPKKKYQVFLF